MTEPANVTTESGTAADGEVTATDHEAAPSDEPNTAGDGDADLVPDH